MYYYYNASIFKCVSIVDKCFLILVDEVVAKQFDEKKITSPLDYLRVFLPYFPFLYYS